MWEKDLQFKAKLLRAQDYVSFLNCFMEGYGSEPKKKISYAQISRKSGISSRAFCREVMIGKRRLTAKTFPKITRALDLKGDWFEFFRLLVAQKEPELNGRSSSDAVLDRQIKRLREKLSLPVKRKRLSEAKFRPNLLLSDPNFPRVYAALGSTTTGATLQEIIFRTRLSSLAVEKILHLMSELNVLRKSEDSTRFIPNALHLDLTETETSESTRSSVIRGFSAAVQAARSTISDSTNLYFESTLCIKSSEFPDLRAELRELLLKYVDKSESSDGDVIYALSLAFRDDREKSKS